MNFYVGWYTNFYIQRKIKSHLLRVASKFLSVFQHLPLPLVFKNFRIFCNMHFYNVSGTVFNNNISFNDPCSGCNNVSPPSSPFICLTLIRLLLSLLLPPVEVIRAKQKF